MLFRSAPVIEEMLCIRIGTKKSGYKPFFQESKYFSSVKEIFQFYNKFKNELIIIDDFNNKITLEELTKELFEFNKFNDKVFTHENSEYSMFFYKDSEGNEFSKNSLLEKEKQIWTSIRDLEI